MTTPTETPSPPTERRLFDIAGAVDYLRSIGATAATRNFVRAIIGRGEVAHVRVGENFSSPATPWITGSCGEKRSDERAGDCA